MTDKLTNLHIHLDIVGGIAGDMFIAAMLDTFEHIQPDVIAATAQVLPKDVGQARLTKGLNLGISGCRFALAENSALVSTANQTTANDLHRHQHNDLHNHNHSHDHSNHNHSHEHHHHEYEHQHSHVRHSHDHHDTHGGDKSHEHQHSHSDETTYQALCQRLSASPLEQNVIAIAIELLTIIGKAEAKIHAKTLADVHFHELADWDSLMDVVASAVILDALSGSTWSISKLPLGGGLVQTQHGLIPVPAPATAEILTGFSFINDGIQGERITPTGAAILRYLKNNQLLTSQPQGELSATGYGLGTKVFPNMPNILRAMSFDINTVKNKQQATIVVIEFDIDDMTGEELALSLDLLRAEQGVVDIVVQNARGKKNRSVELIRILASSQYYQAIIQACFLQTSTIGLRYRFESREFLTREHHQLDLQAYKSVKRPDGETTIKIEHDQLVNVTTLKERRQIKTQVESSLEGKA
ncbi:LarC family nickel insertion protein [Thalassotalea agariperforans]